MTFSVPHEFVPESGQTIGSQEVDDNFAAVALALNNLNDFVGSGVGSFTDNRKITYPLRPVYSGALAPSSNEFIDLAYLLSLNYISTWHFPTRYRASAPPVYATVTTITMAYIAERSGDDLLDIIKLTTTTLSIGSVGLNALDAGAAANNTWYYLYAVTDGTTVGLLASTVNESVTGSISAVNFAYTRKRQFKFAFKTDGSAHILPYTINGGWPLMPKIQYLLDQSTGTTASGATIVLSAGTATTFTSVPCAGFVPPIARRVGLILKGLVSGSSCAMNLRPTGSSLTNGISVEIPYGPGLARVEVPTDASQSVDYKKSGGMAIYLEVEYYIVTEVS